MSEHSYVTLPDRAIIAVGGEERVKFLNGLLSNDVAKVTPDRAQWAALLTPQGKFLHEVFVCQQGETLLLDCEAARADDLLTRLKRYRLRSKATLEPRPDLAVAAGCGVPELALGISAEPGHARALGDGVAYVDPRHLFMGCRFVLPAATLAATLTEAGFSELPRADYDRRRLGLGIPDGSRDLEIEKSTLLECGFAELHGIDFKKGCFVGQELTARMKWRALVKKRLVPVAVSGPLPAPGTAVTAEGGGEAGEMRSGVEGLGIALIRLEYLSAGALTCGAATLTPSVPAWMDLPKEG